MPWRAPSKEVPFCLLHKHNIAVDNNSVTICMPQLCLGSLPDPGRTKKHQAMSIKVDKRAVELDHMSLDSVDSKYLK